MNATKARTRLLFLAREIRTEAQHWKLDDRVFGQLVGLALHLAYLARTADKQLGPVLVAAIDMGTGVIVRRALERAELILAKEAARG